MTTVYLKSCSGMGRRIMTWLTNSTAAAFNRPAKPGGTVPSMTHRPPPVLDEHTSYKDLADPLLGLRRVLEEAAARDAGGKGVERHSGVGEAFEDQQICQIQRWIGTSTIGGSIFQICKKALESSRLPPDRAIRELRGAINYAAAAIILLEEQQKKAQP